MMENFNAQKARLGIVNIETDWFFSYSALHDHHSELQRHREASQSFSRELRVLPTPSAANVRSIPRFAMQIPSSIVY